MPSVAMNGGTRKKVIMAPENAPTIPAARIPARLHTMRATVPADAPPARPHRQHPDHDDEEVRLNAQVRLKARGEHPRDLAAHEPGAHLRESGGSITALSPPLNPLDGIQADAPEVLAEDLTGQAKAAQPVPCSRAEARALTMSLCGCLG